MSDGKGETKPDGRAGKLAAATLVPIEKGIRGFLISLAAVLGLHWPRKKNRGVASTDVGTQLAHERTDLAVERSYLASERTLMGWIRTALSMISFGFTLGKLGQAMQEVTVKGVFGRTSNVSVESMAYFLVVLGTTALLAASLQHIVRVREFMELGLSPKFSIPVAVATLLIFVGGFAMTALVLEL